MTKAQIVEQVLLAVSGGKLTEEGSVRREDIESLLPAAIEMAIDQRDQESVMYNLRLSRTQGVYPTQQGEFLSSSIVSLTHDADRHLYYYPLPSKAIAATSYIPELRPIQGDPYIYVSSQSAIMSIPDCGLVFWWIENYNGFKVMTTPLGMPACEHILKLRLSTDGIADNVELGLGPGVEFRVISMLSEFFNYQKQGLEDNIINLQDDQNTLQARS